MKPISFCINTANNEKDYVILLIKSLCEHTEIDKHEILVFVDTDNQNTYEALVELKEKVPSLKVCKNESEFPVWSQLNVSILFNNAVNDIVCYIQSDMVVGKDFDKHIIANLKDEKTVLCCARIEPPLHPASPEKITKSFGLTPAEFDYDGFNKFVDELQLENRPNEWGHFAPFALYKSTWFNELGGFDTQFRCSREDSDLIIRMGLCDLDLVQSWNACVYHFTCVSSRGNTWYKDEKIANIKKDLQNLADQQELKRFIRKWGFFGHHAKPKYNIAFNVDVDRFVNLEVLKWLEPYCQTLFINNSDVANQLINTLQFESDYYANLRWKYTPEHWKNVRGYYSSTSFDYRILKSDYEETLRDNSSDILVSFKYSELVDEWSEQMRQVLENINSIVFENEIGKYEVGPFLVHVNKKNDISHTLKRVRDQSYTINKYKFI